MDTIIDAGKVRQIRNICFSAQEFEQLSPDQHRKITSTTLNAYGAVVQESANGSITEKGGFRDFIILSSSIASMALGELVDGGNEGSIHEHVAAAVCQTWLTAPRNGRLTSGNYSVVMAKLAMF